MLDRFIYIFKMDQSIETQSFAFEVLVCNGQGQTLFSFTTAAMEAIKSRNLQE